MTAPEPSDYVLLTDPAQHTDVHTEPQLDHIVGGWPVLADGTYGRFEPNPQFRPGSPDTPVDPFDAASRMWARGAAGTADLVELLNETVIGVAVDETGQPLLRTLPDGTAYVTVVSAPLHSTGSELPHWRSSTLDELGPVLPADAAIAVNPYSAAPVLLQPNARQQSAGPG